jgi:hypothetical protein
MSNDTVPAAAIGLPKSNRRLFLVAGSAAALTATLKGIANAATTVDAEIIALSEEVLRLNAIADEITETRIEPFTEQFMDILDPHKEGALDWDTRAKAAWGYSREVGRCAAIEEVESVDEQADAVFKRMLAIPCTTQAGRAAKVRAFLIHVGRSDWRGPDGPLEWPESQARALLGEFAGMSAEELADV